MSFLSKQTQIISIYILILIHTHLFRFSEKMCIVNTEKALISRANIYKTKVHIPLTQTDKYKWLKFLQSFLLRFLITFLSLFFILNHNREINLVFLYFILIEKKQKEETTKDREKHPLKHFL